MGQAPRQGLSSGWARRRAARPGSHTPPGTPSPGPVCAVREGAGATGPIYPACSLPLPFWGGDWESRDAN